MSGTETAKPAAALPAPPSQPAPAAEPKIELPPMQTFRKSDPPGDLRKA